MQSYSWNGSMFGFDNIFEEASFKPANKIHRKLRTLIGSIDEYHPQNEYEEKMVLIQKEYQCFRKESFWYYSNLNQILDFIEELILDCDVLCTLELNLNVTEHLHLDTQLLVYIGTWLEEFYKASYDYDADLDFIVNYYLEQITNELAFVKKQLNL